MSVKFVEIIEISLDEDVSISKCKNKFRNPERPTQFSCLVMLNRGTFSGLNSKTVQNKMKQL